MCSIAGIITIEGYAGDEGEVRAALERMAHALAHRGPDDRGVWLDQSNNARALTVGLANTRLAILDLSPAGHQPMLDEDSGLCLTYNGEIYNFPSLRRELESDAREWHSHTDTEAVLRAYARWGAGCLNKLRGMFALGLWDARTQSLLLARDPFGIKPLYYYQRAGLFIFASEIRALLASGLVPRRLSLEGLASYLDYGSVTAPATIIEGVRSILPGHYMTVKALEKSFQVEELPYAERLSGDAHTTHASSRAEAVAELREILKESVGAHLLSDVPLGVFLSGGMDSSALVALMSLVAQERPRTFSVVFAEGKFTEASHARLVAEKFGTEHHEIPLSEDGLLSMLPRALSAIDQPTMDGINTYVVSKAVRDEGIKVALSGLGGDELFAGYATFRRALRLKEMKRFSQGLRRTASDFGRAFMNNSVQQKKFWQLMKSDGSPYAAYAISRQLFAPDEVQQLLLEPQTSWSEDQANGWHDVVNAVSVYELQGYMANTLLRDSDFMSMAHSLEVRVPFVDPVVVRYVLRLPGEWKMQGQGPKPLLQDVVKGLLPADFLRRPKMGFTLPFETWMQSRLRPELETIFSSEQAFARLGLNAEAARHIWQRFQRHPRRVGWSRPWSLYVLANWCELHQVTL